MRYTTKYAILLTYSNLLSNSGSAMPFQAFQINDNYIDLYNKEDLPSSELAKWNTRYDKIYKNLPVDLNKNPYATVNFKYYIIVISLPISTINQREI